MLGKIINNYTIIRLLGVGGMGNVYLGEHEQLERKVAIKVLHPHLSANESLRKRFRNEASAMAHLQHPNIVALHDYLETEDGLFLIMEYVEGIELDKHIKEVSGPIEEKKAKAIMGQILEGFQYAHEHGVVHRDIKPSNVLLTNDNQVKILDFGIAKLLDTKSMTKTGTQMGTVFYMSPEQVRGEDVDTTTDIYSLGITLFEVLTGKNPYADETSEFEVYSKIVKEPIPNASNFYPGVTSFMNSVIQKATEKEPHKRFKSCSDFLDYMQAGLLKDAIETNSSPLEQITPLTEISENADKHERNYRYLGPLMLVTVVTVVGILLYNKYGSPNEKITSDNTLNSNNPADQDSTKNLTYIDSLLNSDKNLDSISELRSLKLGASLSTNDIRINSSFLYTIIAEEECKIQAPFLTSSFTIKSKTENEVLSMENQNNISYVRSTFLLEPKSVGEYYIGTAKVVCPNKEYLTENFRITVKDYESLNMLIDDTQDTSTNNNNYSRTYGANENGIYHVISKGHYMDNTAKKTAENKRKSGYNYAQALYYHNSYYVSLANYKKYNDAVAFSKQCPDSYVREIDPESNTTTSLYGSNESSHWHIVGLTYTDKNRAKNDAKLFIEDDGYSHASVIQKDGKYYVSLERFKSKYAAERAFDNYSGAYEVIYSKSP